MRRLVKNNRWVLFGLLLAVGAGVGLRFGAVSQIAYAIERGKLDAEYDHLKALDAPSLATLHELSEAYGLIAEAVKPSVVYVEALTNHPDMNRELERLFGKYEFQPHPMTGTGSGVLVDAEGHIVTNNHVVEGADAVRVTLADGRKFKAEVSGVDVKTDLAVIKIEADGLHPARLGDSDAMKVGHIVFAIGSPFRLGHSVSHGIISAMGRFDVNVDIEYQNWLQTDAPINPGNSGGPLINTYGEVVGITTAIASESGGHQGVGFAIPSNVVSRVASVLKRGEKVVRGYLGVEILQLDPAMASAYGLDRLSGVLVNRVFDDTPASKAGLIDEDIVVGVNGKDIATREQFQLRVAETSPGDTIQLAIWRDGEMVTVVVEVAAQPPNFSTTGLRNNPPQRRPELNEEDAPAVEKPSSDARGDAKEEETGHYFEELGFRGATVSQKLRERFQLGDGIRTGVVILHVDAISDAFDARLSIGQVVTRANGRRIRSLAQLKQVLTAEALAKGVRLRIRAGNDTLHAVLRKR